MVHLNIVKEVTSMLYWTMLAACTVGPGTVVTCARAGAEFDLSLTWALLFASALAYTLQEGTARLTIVSGRSLGQCLRIKYQHTVKVYNTAILCWVVAGTVILGNTLYECNNWAGGIDAVMSIPGASDLTGSAAVGLRVGCCIVYAVIVLALLYWDKTDTLGVFLGFVMLGMVTLFLIVVVFMGLDWTKFGWGLLPNLPEKTETSAEPADIIISLVGTTSIGFNLFLGGAMAKGKELVSAQRGIAFSTISALMVSVLILIVGAGYHDEGSSSKFTITQLGGFIEQFVGKTGVVVFAIGFIAAALSSMLTVPLGAALTADSVFSEERQEVKGKSEKIGTDNPNFEDDDMNQNNSEKSTKVELDIDETESQKLPRFVYFGIIFIMVLIATVVISANADRTLVILIAQVFNGCLLPFFSICLLLCLNDLQFMSSSPQPSWANAFLLISVTITLFLASNVIIQKIFGTVLTGVSVRLGIAIGVAVGGVVVICVVTSLGRDLLRSFRLGCTKP
eukprot:GFUD01044552.1.p1 GENE.GFUD01044552.1~~GFUD01044552.1.p1  ORF type:complete len:508 (+),score=112.68 GFUD01044552.1:183-1706(+)